jgi:hypothetical protein
MPTPDQELDAFTNPPPVPQPETSPPAPIPFPKPAPVANPDAELDAFVNLDKDQDRLKAATAAGLEQDPARAAKLIQYSNALNVPTEFVDRNFDALQAAVRQKDFDPETFRRESPIVAQWLSEDPARVGLTRDDLPAFASIERLVRSSPDYRYGPDGSIHEILPGGAYSTIYANPMELHRALVKRGLLQDEAQSRVEGIQRDQYFGSFGAGFVADLASTLSALHRLGGDQDEANRFAEIGGEQISASIESSPGLAGTLGRGFGGLAAQLPLLAVGGPVARGAEALMKARMVGTALAPILGEAGTAALERGVVGAATMQPIALRGALNDDHGVGHALGSWAIDSAIAGAFPAVIGEQVGAARGIARAAGVAVGPGEAELSAAQVLLRHTGLGASQNLAFDVAHRIHDVASGADPTAMDWDKLLPSLAVSGILGAAPGALFSLPEAAAAARQVHDRAGMVKINAIAEAAHHADTLDAAANDFAEAKASALNQDAVQGLLQKIAGDTPYRTLYVDARAWRDHFNAPVPAEDVPKETSLQASVAPDPTGTLARAAAIQATGDPLAYDKAISTDGQLAIPFDRFLPLLNDPARHDFLRAEARVSPEAMNEREAHGEVNAATTTAQAQAAAAGPGTPEADREASADLVHEDIKRQQIEAGVSEPVAERGASLWRAIFHTASARGWTKLLPHELYAQMKVRIARGLQAPGARDALDAMILRLKAGEIPTEADVQKAMTQQEGETERRPTEDSTRIQQTRDALLGILEHFRSVGADIQKETPEQLKARLVKATDEGQGDAFEQQAEGPQAQGRPIVIADVPYGAGSSSDGRTVYIDRRIPRFLEIEGKRVDVHQMIAEHEIAEKTRMDRGESYAQAHAQALAIEDAEIDHQGVSHEAYEKALKPYLDEAKSAAAKEGIPADLEAKPYHDMGEGHLIAGATGEAYAHPYEQRTPAIAGMKLTDAEALRARAEAQRRGELGKVVDKEAPTGVFPALRQENEGVPRGTFLPQRLSKTGESIIRLLKGADRSTFLHESAHFLLEFLHHLGDQADAPAALKTDLAGIREWLGAKEGAAITREQHELFARGFEKYLMEGKAPSPVLRGAFERFKRWLVEIYKSDSALNVHLTPDVRQIFDRILASDDEIAAARAEVGADQPFYENQAESGMNDQQWSAYLNRTKEGQDTARAMLEREVMGPLRAEETKSYQDERARVKLQVADRVNQSPVYTALLVLQKGAWPEGVEIPEGSERVKLDKSDLVNRYGEAGLALLPGPQVEGEAPKANRGRRLYTEEGGITLDDAAELFGFRDGGSLWHALVNAPDRTAEIERTTDAEMRDRRPDPMLDGSLTEKARIAVANDPRLEVMDREAAALAMQTKRAATPSQLLRAIARAQIEKTLARDIRPSLYRVAMGRASRAALAAKIEARHATDPEAKAKLLNEALRQKTTEILQTHLYREASKAVEQSEKRLTKVQSWNDLAKRAKVGKAGGWEWTVSYRDAQGKTQSEAFTSLAYGDSPEKAQQAAVDRATKLPGADVQRTGYLEQADGILEGYDLKRVSTAALQRREALRDFIARKEANDEPINIPTEVVEDLGRKNWRDLTIAEQTAVVDALDNLQHLAYKKNDLLSSERRETFTESRDAQIATIVKNSRGVKPEKSVGSGILDTPADIAGRYFSSMATVSRLVREMDGYQDGGVMFDTWLRKVNEANDRELDHKERSTEKMAELVKTWGKLKPGSPGMSIRRMEPAIGKTISHWGRIMVALNWGNADNRARLMQSEGWTEGQVRSVMSKLDQRDMRFVQGILDHIDTYWPEIKAKQERVTGIAPEKVDAVPILHETGVYRGGYFPIAYDQRSMPKGKDMTVEQQSLMTRNGARLFATTQRGHTETRTAMPEGARVLLDPSVITRHLNNVAHDLAYHETLIDLNRFLRDKDLRQTMIAHWGADAYRQFQSRLTDVAAGVQGTHTGIEQVLEWGRQGVNFANRAFNLGSALQQAAGLPASIIRVGPKHFASALYKMFRNPAGADSVFKWVDDQSIMMRNRSKTFDKNINDAMGGVSLRGPIRKLMDGAGYYFWTKAFQVLDTHTWLASYSKAMEEHGGDEGNAKAIADQTVTDIQGSGATKDLPAVMRGGPLAQVFTSNMSWWLANYNLTAEAINRAKSGKMSDVLKSGADLFVLYGAQVAAWSALSAALTGKNEKQWEEAADNPLALAKTLSKDAAYTALSSMVLLRDLADVAVEGRQYRGPQGLKSMSLVASAIQAIRSDSENAAEAKSVAKAAGLILHVPIAQIVSTAEGIVDASEKGDNPLWPALFGKRQSK